MFTDWKTTVTGLVTALCTILAGFGIIIPAEWLPVIIAIGTITLSYFAKDKNK